MSYRVRVNNQQLFGNGCCYDQWNDFIRSQGIAINEHNEYCGEITDFMGALKTIENIVLSIQEYREKNQLQSLYDCSFIKDSLNRGEYLFEELMDMTECGILFLPYHFFKICEPMLDADYYLDDEGRFRHYNLKEGYSIVVEAS